MTIPAPIRRVLFVDDEQNVLSGIRRALHSMRGRWEVAAVGGGEEALEVLRRTPQDVVIADMQMPGMDGGELLATIAERHPRVVRFALSGHTDREMVMKAAGVSHQFFAKPCDMRKLKLAIARAFQFQDLLDHAPAMQALVSRTEVLPLLPETYTALLNCLGAGNDEARLEELSRIARSDVAVAVKLLHLAHWVFFDPARQVRSIERAVGFLGPELIRNLFYTTNLLREWPAPMLERFDVRALCRHGQLCGALAGRIARTLSPSARFADDAAVGGLLHDVGKLVLAAGCPREYEVVLDEHRETGAPLHELERTMFGADHAFVGGALLTLWGIPRAIAQAVTYHHEPERARRAGFVPVVSVHAANEILVNIERHAASAGGVEAREPLIAEAVAEWRRDKEVHHALA